MTKTDFTITLRFRSDGETRAMLGEDAVIAAFEADAEAKPPYGQHLGQIVFNPGANEIFIGGAMQWLIPKFCLQTPDFVFYKGTYSFEMADSEAVAIFTREGDTIVLTGSEDDTHLVFPAEGFYMGMLAAAERYAAICAAIWPEDSAPDVEEIGDEVARLRQEMAAQGA